MLTLRSDQLEIRDRYAGRWRRAWQFLAEKGPLELWRVVRRNGARECVAFVRRNLRYLVAMQANRRFDRRHHVDTGGDIPTRFLDVVGDNKEYGSAFLSTPARSFRRMLRLLPDDVRDFVFVDIGAGKGRCLLLASERAFKRILGVEYARELAACARRNIASFRSAAQRCRDISCLCADATQFDIPDEKCVFYFLRPFEYNVMARFLANVERSYRARPRKIYILFANPAEPEYAPPHDQLVGTGMFALRRAEVLPFDWGAVTTFQVSLYESRPV
jgi:hypothetical protein